MDVHRVEKYFAKSDLVHMMLECRVLSATLSEAHKALGVMMEDAEDADPDTLHGYIPDTDPFLPNMTYEYWSYLNLLIELNGILCIGNPRRSPRFDGAVFRSYTEVGWHASTRQLVLRRGVRIDENCGGEDSQFRDRWNGPRRRSAPTPTDLPDRAAEPSLKDLETI